ncbi:MAG: RNA methyltransferase [Porphyromonas sp.]|nr:RNA methyltransferase [Porphyromonas sp.]
MVSEEHIKPLSDKERKVISSLRLAKKRREEGLFVAEGVKSIELLLPAFRLRWLVYPETFQVPFDCPSTLCRIATDRELSKLSSLDSRQEVMAVFEIPAPADPSELDFGGLAVGLDQLQNPGNLGTIIRLCDWLGIKSILCSEGTVDVYNPKTVQASMGALGHVHVYQGIDLPSFLPRHFGSIITTAMEGSDFRDLKGLKDSNTIVIFGNEGNGISEAVRRIATTQVTIPKAEGAVSDSLNVSLSAAILLSSLIY